MSQLTWLGLGAALLLFAATLVGTRLTARRAAGPLEVRLLGEVPPVPDWLPAALAQFAAGSRGATAALTDDIDDQILRGHRAEVKVPAAGVELRLRMQPHLVLATFGRAHPLVIIIEIDNAPSRSGLSGLIYGRTPTPAATQVRTSLAQTLVRAARERGVIATTSAPGGAALLAAGGFTLVGVALVVALITPGQHLMAEINAAPSPSPTPWYPANAKECPGPAKKPAKGPTRSAAAKGTSCAFAESVRAAYAKAKVSGKTVKLGKIRYDKKTSISISCTVGRPYVTCRGGNKQVYLS